VFEFLGMNVFYTVELCDGEPIYKGIETRLYPFVEIDLALW
jgi:hypothetical protein